MWFVSLFKAVFGNKKRPRILSDFFFRDLQIVGGHICYVCFMTILSSQKLNVEYRFWLQKGSNIMIFDPTPTLKLWVVSFGLTHDHFIKTKAGKLKMPFLVTKRGQNHIWHVFLIRNPQIMGGFICYFWPMTILPSQKLKNAKYRF